MFRIDNSTSVGTLPAPTAAGTPGYFTNGNPVSGQQATIVEADWMNMVQEELMSILSAAGVTASKATFNQILASLPAALASRPEMARSLAPSGYQKLPGGLILQWGGGTTASGTLTQTLPIAFPNAQIRGWCTDQGAAVWAANNVSVCGIQSLTTSQIILRAANWNGSAFSLTTAVAISWLAIGW